jgi:hypothetical protein
MIGSDPVQPAGRRQRPRSRTPRRMNHRSPRAETRAARRVPILSRGDYTVPSDPLPAAHVQKWGHNPQQMTLVRFSPTSSIQNADALWIKALR